MDRRAFLGTVAGGIFAAPLAAEAQQPRVYRVGVVLQGGLYLGAVDGLRKGLAELGLQEGRQVVLHVESAANTSPLWRRPPRPWARATGHNLPDSDAERPRSQFHSSSPRPSRRPAERPAGPARRPGADRLDTCRDRDSSRGRRKAETQATTSRTPHRRRPVRNSFRIMGHLH